MRIIDVKVHLVPTPAAPPYRWRAGLPGSERGGVGAVLRVMTDEGVAGIGPRPHGAGHRLRGALGRYRALGKRTACRIA
jgi:hypothetical protein